MSGSTGTAEERRARRQAAVPAVTYPAELPVSARREDLLAALRDHQVVVVAGETGSGKTTQLPKMCLELGRGVDGMIGHTQPRRIAARAVAERLAEELDVELGGAVGFQVRFTDRVGDDTLVKVMTDGILLAEIAHDPELRRYDTVIVDEAHERSLTIDFLLGYLARLLPRRPDLKVVITSATIDPGRFAAHFGDAPVVEVSGRTYPVEIRYRPYGTEGGDDDADQVQAVLDAVDELAAVGPGDVLVFLSGEREIRDVADALQRDRPQGTEVLPLYGRLSAAEQHRVFAPHPGRRIVLSTNVAETSLTVPGIRYVVDAGTARISRYSHRLKVQRLPIEPISQASARQRAGRCGRVEAGVCIRLYSEQDYESRPAFTEPEVQRTNLASVVLQMAALGLGEVADFPFLDPPDRRSVRDGVQLLEELRALERDARGEPRLTRIGRRLARLPLDPRLGRMVLEAERNGCVQEVLVVAAALSIQDPRERPTDEQAVADAMHARFADPNSDFLGYLSLWDYLQERQRELSSGAFRRLCRGEYLHYLRVREWQDLVGQLRQAARSVGLHTGRTARTEGDDDRTSGAAMHRSLLAGLLSHVGTWDAERRDYLGARGARFALWPGSALARRKPTWVMAGELVETSRLWGRDVARIDPDWIEPLAGHLVARVYSEPHWSARHGAAMAYEKVTLYGLPVVTNRRVPYARVDPDAARELFLRHALVGGEWRTHHRFWQANQDRLAAAADLEERTRRRDVVVDDQAVFGFYDARVPADVVSVRHFDAWWKQARRETPHLLDLRPEDLVRGDADVDAAAFPDEWEQDGLRLPLDYRFDPGAADDGVTVRVPLAALPSLDPYAFEWQVPGRRHELITALLRTLPEEVRRAVGPAPEVARTVTERLSTPDGPILDAVAREVRAVTGVDVPPAAWQPQRLPDHLRPTYRVEDGRGRVVGTGTDLADLRRRLAPVVRRTLADVSSGLERTGLRDWGTGAAGIGTLPRTFDAVLDGQTLRGYPSLVDESATVGVRLLESADEQRNAMWLGTRRLLLLTVPSPVRAVHARLSTGDKLALTGAPHASPTALFDDCIAAALDTLVAGYGGPAWDEPAWRRLREAVGAELVPTVLDVVRLVVRVLAATAELRAALDRASRQPALSAAVADVRAQLAALVQPGFVAGTGRDRLRHLERYLQAAARRLETAGRDPALDRARAGRIAAVEAAYADTVAALPPARRGSEDVRAVRWMVEELRVSVFAQSLGTAHPVSEERIGRVLADLAGR